MTRIFLSYARADDGEPFDPVRSFVARLHRDLMAAGFEVWFDRVSMPSRSLTFHQEIREAVAASDRLVLVVGPKAVESLYVRQEWQFAYFEAEKIVTPLLRRGDFSIVPDELKLLHCEDFRDEGQYDFHLKNLSRQLAEPAPALGKLIGVPSLPPHFLSRTDRLTALRDALRADLDRPVVITGAAARVGMHGMGGIGKSVLAATLSRDRKIREAFPDGIVWVGLGPLPTVADLQRRVHKDLGGDGAFQTEHEGRVKLRDILKDKSVLLILDDIWRRQDVDWFDVLGPRCRAMITTRDTGLLTSLGGVHHQVELLTDAEALNLLAQAAGVERDKLPNEAADLIAECGRLPLAVALCGGLIRSGFAWDKVLDQLRTSRIDRIKDPHPAKVEHENIWNAIDVSVKFLNADEQARFLELAVFPSDEATPIAALRTLWSHTAGFDDWDTDALVIKLSQRSLLELTTSADGKAISLHDLVYDYVHHAAGDEITLHERLLDAYRKKCPDGWHVDPPNDGYFFTHLRHHLIKVGRAGELADLLHELRWLEAKNEAGLTFDLTVDFEEAMKALPETDPRQRNLRLLDEALRRDIHFIARHAQDYPQGLFQCLWNSCWWYDTPEAAARYDLTKSTGNGPLPWDAPSEERISTVLQCWHRQKEGALPGFLWLRSFRPPVIHLHTPQKAVFRGHEDDVKSVIFSPDGQLLASASSDKTLRVWDAVSGAELLCLMGHERYVNCVAFSPDGRRLASGSGDATIRIWDAIGGVEALCLRGHSDVVWSLVFSPHGQLIASGSHDGTVRIWDTTSGDEIRCLRGHFDAVESVSFSPDGRLLASGGRDGLVRVWGVQSGVEQACARGHEETVFSVVFSPDGQRLASGSQDATVRLWDAHTGTETHCFHGHQAWVRNVTFTTDGQLLASCSGDNTIRLWDPHTGAEIHCFRGHTSVVESVAFSPDCRVLASGSWDRTVRLWDTRNRASIRYLNGHDGHFVWSQAWSPDGQLLATGADDRSLRIWDAQSGVELRRLRVPVGEVNSLAFSSDGRLLASSSSDKVVRVWEMRSDRPRCLRGHKGTVGIVAFAPDGWLASGSSDKTVRVWDTRSRVEMLCLRGHERSVDSLAFSPDGNRLASGSWDNSVRVWDLANGTELLCLRGHEKCVDCVAFSPNGRHLVSGSSDKTLRIWDATSGAEILCLPEQEGEVRTLAFSPDGRVIAASVRTWRLPFVWTVCVWDVGSGVCQEVVEGSTDVASIAGGGTLFPWRAIERKLESVIQFASTDRPIAWWPTDLQFIRTHPSGRIWAGSEKYSLCLFTLEGDVDFNQFAAGT